MRIELVGRQQQHQQEEEKAFERKSTTRGTRKNMTISIIEEDEEESPEIVDLSGMSLDSLPVNPTINLGAISKLHLSNNNLQVSPPLYFVTVVSELTFVCVIPDNFVYQNQNR